MNRRHFLRTSLAAAAALSAGAVQSAYAARPAPLGVQLFTVMTELERDFDGTLRTLARIGYREVETIGAFGRDPAVVRRAFDAAGLVSPSQHLMARDLYANFLAFTRHQITAEAVGEAWKTDMAAARMPEIIDEAIGRAKVMGQKFIVLQMIWPEQMATRAALDEFCRALNLAGAACAKAGLTFNFHNHSEEFARIGDYVPYDVILKNTDPTLVKLELDIYWAARAKQDPVRLFAENPGRFVQCHVKDSTADGDFATVGKGVIDFKRILPAARRAGVRHFYVEYDRADDPMAVVREAYPALRRAF